ncbi:MAG: tripartite tricarboxylate transporter permease [Rhodospirillales bacterium]
MEFADIFDHVLHGFTVALQWKNIMFLFIGALLGTVIGIMPGIGSSAGIALLLPMTFGMDPIPSLIMLSGIYYGAMYGNTASAVLINTPGTASASMTTVDGYPMAKKGRGGAALAAAAIASFIAGTIGIVGLTFLSIPFTNFALKFGPAEYFMLMFFAMSAVSSLTGRSVPKGLFAAFLGLMIASVGMDLQTGMPRYVFDIPELQAGISFLIVIVGAFAVAEVLLNVEKWFGGKLEPIKIQGSLYLTWEEWKRCWRPIIRGGLIGFFIGVLPGAGGTIATVIAYSTEQKLSKYGHEFGTGAIEGVAAPEAANNASTCGAFVPLLTLGIPGSGTTAVLLGAFILYGLEPGAELFVTHPDLVWGLIDSMYIGNVFLIIMNLPLIGVFVRVLYLPPGVLLSIILAVASVGIYSINNNTTDLYLLLFFGAMGYGFRKLQIPIPPLILGLVLGALMENSLRQALIISNGNLEVFVTGPICITLLVMSIAAIVLPVIGSRMKIGRGRALDDE